MNALPTPSSNPSPYPSRPTTADYASSPNAAATAAAAALSEPHVPTPNGNTASGRKRKANGTPSGRGVANMTREQLEKKRANDREAQRAIRERTRTHIEELEGRIRELEGQEPFQDLQRVMMERDQAREECAQLKAKLAMVQSVLSSNAPPPPPYPTPSSQPGLHELAALTAQQTPLPPIAPQTRADSAHSVAGAMHERQQHLDPDLRSPRSRSPPSVMKTSPVSQTSTTERPSHQGEGGMQGTWSPGVEQKSSAQDTPNPGVTYEPRLPPPAAMLEQSNGERLALDYVLEPRRISRTPLPSQYTQPPLSETPIYARLPKNTVPCSPLDELLLQVWNNLHGELIAGKPMHQVAGPDYPSFEGLLDSAATIKDQDNPRYSVIGALLTEVLFKFPDIKNLPEKVAVLYIMFLIVRWMICPCRACYERLPEWVRPLKEQLESPHPAWFDHLPWPYMRLRLITTEPQVQFEDFFVPFTSKVNLNWPSADEDVLVPDLSAREPGSVMMNPAFERHLRELGNWSVGPEFAMALPQLVDESVRIRNVVDHE